MPTAMRFRGTFVHLPTLGQLEVLNDHLLVVDDRGFISHLAPAHSQPSLHLLHQSSVPPTIIPTGSFLLPTFCDLHLHAPQFLYQGNGLHLPLMQWLNEYAFKAEEAIDSDPSLASNVYSRLASRLIQNGTGSVLLFGTIKEETNLILAKVMQSAGIRAFVGKLSMDISSRPSYVEPSAQHSLSSVTSFVTQCRNMVSHLPTHKRLVEPVITPRFVPTCSDDLLAGLGKLSESESIRIQSHLAEAHDQVQWVRRERGADDIDIFHHHNLLTPRTILAHCTFLTVPSLSQLSSCGTAISHCPLSNAYFSAKPFPLREALQQGVKVGLGTDIAGGYTIDLMNSMRQAVAVSKMREGSRILARDASTAINDSSNTADSLAIDWKESLYLATRGGTLALGLPHGCGLFKVGAPFDAQQLRLWDPDTQSGIGALDFFSLGSSVTNGDGISLSIDALEKWWCLGDTRNRVRMWVQGAELSSAQS